jgi:hypothetical protein
MKYKPDILGFYGDHCSLKHLLDIAPCQGIKILLFPEAAGPSISTITFLVLDKLLYP